MHAFVAWFSAALALAMFFPRATRNSAYLASAGSTLGLLFHYDIGTVPEIEDLAFLLWAAAILIVAVKTLPSRRRRTA